MTNQQGAPEALTDFEHRHAIRQGYEIAASDGYFEARPQIDSNDRRYAFRAGFERGWDRHAALAEAQQPATHVQNPVEIEHVAGDVSKNAPESNMAQQPAPSAAVALSDDLRDRLVAISAAIADQDDRAAQAMLREILKAPQPFPTAQADSAPRQRQLLAQADPVSGSLVGYFSDEKPPFATHPSPQADSQPAPVGDEKYPIRKLNRYCHAHMCQETDAQHEPDCPQGRAARAPADSVTAPAGGAVAEIGSASGEDAGFGQRAIYPLVDIDRFEYGTKLYANTFLSAEPWGACIGGRVWVGKQLPDIALKLADAEGRQIQWLYTTPPAQAADSVLEDAARLDWLDRQREAYGFQEIHEGNRWEISGAYANVREAIDAERAARKQGGA